MSMLPPGEAARTELLAAQARFAGELGVWLCAIAKHAQSGQSHPLDATLYAFPLHGLLVLFHPLWPLCGLLSTTVRQATRLGYIYTSVLASQSVVCAARLSRARRSRPHDLDGLWEAGGRVLLDRITRLNSKLATAQTNNRMILRQDCRCDGFRPFASDHACAAQTDDAICLRRECT